MSSYGYAQDAPLAYAEFPENDATCQLDAYPKDYYAQVFGFRPDSLWNEQLYQAIESWMGTPYRYAGKNESGIDCSAFVNRVYSQVYRCMLPGNSADMARTAKSVKKSELKEGDLVFFRINRRHISHVGVYLGRDKFAHASRSQGVIISDLNQPYYKKYFVKGGRVPAQTH